MPCVELELEGHVVSSGKRAQSGLEVSEIHVSVLRCTSDVSMRFPEHRERNVLELSDGGVPSGPLEHMQFK